MAINQETLEGIHKAIDREIAVVEAELTDLGFAPDGTVEVTFDEGFADAAQTTSERAKTLSLAEGLRQRLAEARAAVARIEKGSYGLCESCGKQIPADRLEAVPCTPVCIECKQKDAGRT